MPKIALLSREYPPEVYGGAGVHVEYLARELRSRVELQVHCFGADRTDTGVTAHAEWERLAGKSPHLAALRTLSVDLSMVRALEGARLVHSHTWYTNLAGHLAKLVYGVPHVMTVHSLEPLRPWKAEQLGGGYALSSFCERIAIEQADRVIAVSEGMRQDVLDTYPNVKPERTVAIPNGIDPEQYRPAAGSAWSGGWGIDPKRPYVVFVGRITRQKGLPHLLRAARELAPGVGLVLCAGAPDTPELADQVRRSVTELSASRPVVWIEQMLAREAVIEILSHASVFVCPSVYEPFGIVNVEAMACGVPVVASAVGGIPEVVVDGETGSLVPAPLTEVGQLRDADAFEQALAQKINELIADPDRAREMGKRGRARVIREFSWGSIADRVTEVYADLLGPT